jgi:hypothetical protein
LQSYCDLWRPMHVLNLSQWSFRKEVVQLLDPVNVSSTSIPVFSIKEYVGTQFSRKKCWTVDPCRTISVDPCMIVLCFSLGPLFAVWCRPCPLSLSGCFCAFLFMLLPGIVYRLAFVCFL